MRLVNRATSKWIASQRCSESACEETSITQAESPASSIRLKVASRSIASGVVRTTSSSTPPTTCFTVPSRPERRPSASRISRSRKAVVVLPLVPVIPAIVSEAVGSPKKRAAIGAIAARASATRTCGHGQLEVALDHQRGRAGLDRGRGEVVPVGAEPRHAEVERLPPPPCGCRRRARAISTARSPGVSTTSDPSISSRSSMRGRF